MGKGDIKTKKGKISNKSYGNSRPRKEVKEVKATKETKETAPAKPAEKKSEKKK